MATKKKKTGKKTGKKTATKSNIGELRDAFAELHTALTAAYWAAGTMDDKDRIRGVQDIVYDILTDLNRADITSRTAEMKAIKKEINAATTDLKKLKEEIDQIIKAIKIASNVVKGIERVLKTAAKLAA